MMRIDSAARTHVGRRSNNEDNHCAEPSLGLFAVADGMGGYEGGEVASQLTIGALAAFFRKNADDELTTWPWGMDAALDPTENLLDVGVRLAHREVRARKVGKLQMMGSTVAALVVRGERAVIGHVGDSRVYRLRDGRLEQLTRDHSLYAEMVAAGGAVPAREDFPYANVITRALGMDSPRETRPDLRCETLRAGDVYLLCTDGLIEKLGDDALAKLLAERASADAICARLVEEAYHRGGRDNITAVVLRVL